MSTRKYAIGALLPTFSSADKLSDELGCQDSAVETEPAIEAVGNSLSPPVDFSHYFSVSARNREASDVKEFYRYFQIPGIQNLAGGLPHVSYFPYDTLEANVAFPARFDTSSPIASDWDVDTFAPSQPPSSRVTIPKIQNTADLTKRIDLATALQYGTSQGYPPLYTFIRQFVREALHPSVPYEGGPEVILTCGATDGFAKAVEALTNIWDERRDWIRNREGILCEEFIYMNAIQTARPRGLNVAAVAMDSDGMMVQGKGGLADVLENWDFHNGKRPHLMYTVTIGQNPSGAVMPTHRRREIYALCQKYDIIIVEDEPYWNLQYPSAARLEAQYRGSPAPPNTHALTQDPVNINDESSKYPFLASLTPSYLSIDTDGRVIRLDTFSKTIAPGCRLGWLTAQPKIIERITYITDTSTQQPSGFVQAMVAGLIMGNASSGDVDGDDTNGEGERESEDKGWNMDGWVRWLEGLRDSYEKRMQIMCEILETGRAQISSSSSPSSSTNPPTPPPYPFTAPSPATDWQLITKTQMFTFHFPRAGMFVWVKMFFETHPLWSQIPSTTTSSSNERGESLSLALWKHLTQKPFLCLVAPGRMFDPVRDGRSEAWRYYRLCFAALGDGDVGGAARGFVEGVQSFWGIREVGDVIG
ncbi:hypothetical protein FQN55_005825 [Onygenales sp. PD_40]|nr:hypothetical protein FQN55_005825 [Onygenales sp. PD_40]KAK2763000.1 hypothetical protein FQN53_007387 [Emmonsiellopsis sp. PD_33]KAK2784202.1 hypothetical protein FQN52_009144 [Onygenales sp. PD_12]KAK2792544.1 hypothetical protein FQN51_001662 [Onygenales sp. PD_10]